MQPLNTAARPSSASTMGWPPRSERSMIFRRRWPSAIGPAACTPVPSGPRRCIASVMRATAATSGIPPSSRISPAIPHIGASHGLRSSQWTGDRADCARPLVLQHTRPGVGCRVPATVAARAAALRRGGRRGGRGRRSCGCGRTRSSRAGSRRRRPRWPGRRGCRWASGCCRCRCATPRSPPWRSPRWRGSSPIASCPGSATACSTGWRRRARRWRRR